MRRPEQVIGGPCWTQRDGTTIPLSDMSDSHLENALAMCVRMGRLDAIRMLADELELRSEKILDDCVVGGCDRYGSLSND